MTDRIYYSRDAEMRVNRDRFFASLFVLGIGLGIGTVLAMLFAPRPGDETRKLLSNSASEALDTGREATSKAVEGLQKDIERLRKDFEDRVKS